MIEALFWGMIVLGVAGCVCRVFFGVRKRFFAPAPVFRPSPKRVDCAWCGDGISAGVEPVSHGICPVCMRGHFPELL